METLLIKEVHPQNVETETLFCIKDKLNPGFACKQDWYKKRYAEGLRLCILEVEGGEKIGFIEYVPVASAWRPVIGDDYMFIHCMYVYPNRNKNKGYGSKLINWVEQEARGLGLSGVCVMTSKGTWMADKRIFEKNGYSQVDKRGRFELLSKKWNDFGETPQLIDWTVNQSQYQGWHLLYADQCPWHEKSVNAILETAKTYDLDLKVTRINTANKAKSAPSGYGVFSLLHNGKLLEDHYISATRFKNILKKELKPG